MKVLMQARVSLFAVPGGDTVQIVETMRALRRLGVEADLSTSLTADLRSYALVHLFNLGRVQETAFHARRAAQAGVTVVLSPIYWNPAEFERRGHFGMRAAAARVLRLETIERLRGLWRYCVDRERNPATRDLVLRGWRRLQRYALSAASCLLPNSAAELELLRRDFGGLPCPAVVVPNGVSPSFGDGPQGERSGVACVGRIDPRKNQLRLARALRDGPQRLTLVGEPAPNHRRYLARTLRCGGDRVTWLGPMRHEQICGVLWRSAVHALPSWFETPGLASLEAAAAGCAVVVSNRGSTREYFGNDAHYCEPHDIASIAQAVARACASPPPARLRERVLSRFTWDEAARRTLVAYEVALGAGAPSDELAALPAPGSQLTSTGTTAS
jgi:glycosyltransferase involved in cell wall biosynthesis